MAIASWSRQILGKATPIVGAATLGAIALVGVPESAKAAADCSLGKDGVNWVNECPEGRDYFPNSWAFIDLWLDVPLLEEILQQDIFPENFTGHRVGDNALMLSGPVVVDREEGENGIIKTVLNHTLTGSDNFLGDISLSASGTGEIKDPDGDGMAGSFFDVDFSIDAGALSLFGSTTIVGDRQLKGVSPDMVENGVVEMTCPYAELFPDAAITYCGDGLLFTEVDGIVYQVGQLNETHIVHPVPEPGTAIASIFGLGAMLGFTKKRLAKQDK